MGIRERNEKQGYFNPIEATTKSSSKIREIIKL